MHGLLQGFRFLVPALYGGSIALLCLTAAFAALHTGDVTFVAAVLLAIASLFLLAPWRPMRSTRPVTVRRRRARVRTASILEASLAARKESTGDSLSVVGHTPAI